MALIPESRSLLAIGLSVLVCNAAWLWVSPWQQCPGRQACSPLPDHEGCEGCKVAPFCCSYAIQRMICGSQPVCPTLWAGFPHHIIAAHKGKQLQSGSSAARMPRTCTVLACTPLYKYNSRDSPAYRSPVCSRSQARSHAINTPGCPPSNVFSATTLLKPPSHPTLTISMQTTGWRAIAVPNRAEHSSSSSSSSSRPASRLHGSCS